MQEIWYKKHRPTNTDGYVFQNEALEHQVKDWIAKKNFPSLLLLGQAGSGKTTLAHLLAERCEYDDADIRLISASIDNGIDVIREKVVDFANRSAFSEQGRLVIIDECLEENERVRVGTVDNWTAVALKDLEWGKEYPIVSFNMETGQYENDTGTLISEKEDLIYTVTLYNGTSVKLNAKHPFIVFSEDGTYIEKTIEGGLAVGDLVVVSAEDVASGVGSIEVGSTARVLNLTVHKNHTFVTENGIVTHNCDYLSPNAQAGLRNVIGENDHVRFILIGNYPHKIIDALKSRCMPIMFNEMSKNNFIARLCDILIAENVNATEEALMAHVEACYPDLRKAINSLEAMTKNGVLQMPIVTTGEATDWMNYALAYFESGDIETGRKYILDNITYDDYEFFYDYLYRNVEIFSGTDADKRDACIIAIADALVTDVSVANREINLSACLSRLSRIARTK